MIKIMFCRFLLFFLVFGLFSEISVAQKAMTAEQVAQKAASLVSGSKGVEVGFTISGNGNNGSGTIKTSGNKFVVTLPGVSIWYDGKDLYTCNLKSSETTIVKPTAQELLESNPLLYVKGGGVAYTYNFAPQKVQGKYIIEMVPRKKNDGVKKLIFTVNANDFKIEKIIAKTGNGDLTVSVSKFVTGQEFPSSVFVYPKSKYPGNEIIDLRD